MLFWEGEAAQPQDKSHQSMNTEKYINPNANQAYKDVNSLGSHSNIKMLICFPMTFQSAVIRNSELLSNSCLFCTDSYCIGYTVSGNIFFLNEINHYFVISKSKGLSESTKKEWIKFININSRNMQLQMRRSKGRTRLKLKWGRPEVPLIR